MSQLKVNCRSSDSRLETKTRGIKWSRKWYWHRQWWKWRFNCGRWRFGSSGSPRSNASTASVQSPVVAAILCAICCKTGTPLHKSVQGATPAAKPAQVPQPIVPPEPSNKTSPNVSPKWQRHQNLLRLTYSSHYPRTLCTELNFCCKIGSKVPKNEIY